MLTVNFTSSQFKNLQLITQNFVFFLSSHFVQVVYTPHITSCVDYFVVGTYSTR